MITTGVILQWLGSIIAGGGVGAVITYIVTFRSNKKKAEADAEVHVETAE
jgi:hypothetical protein